MVFFASSILKNIIAFAPPSPAKFSVKLICYIASDQHQVFFVYLNIINPYNCLLKIAKFFNQNKQLINNIIYH